MNQGSYAVWKSMEFDLSNFQVWKSMEKKKAEYGKIFAFQDFDPDIALRTFCKNNIYRLLCVHEKPLNLAYRTMHT